MHYMIREIREEINLLDRYMEMELAKPREAFEKIRQLNGCITTGNGTSYNAAYYLSILLIRRGILTVPVFSSEFASLLNRGDESLRIPVILFSQSGETTDSISAANIARKHGSFIVSVSNVPGSSLLSLSDVQIITPAGQEKSIAATKSHMGQLLSSLSIYYSDQPNLFKAKLTSIRNAVSSILALEDKLKKMAQVIGSKIVFLGSGLLYPTAREGALKLKETCSLITDAYPTREFLHGPKQILDDSWTVFLLSEDESVKQEVSAFCHNVTDLPAMLRDTFHVEINDEILLSIAEVFFLQLLSYYKAISLALDPDKPSKLTKVVRS